MHLNSVLKIFRSIELSLLFKLDIIYCSRYLRFNITYWAASTPLWLSVHNTLCFFDYSACFIYTVCVINAYVPALYCPYIYL